MAIPMLKIRRPNGRLIFNMGIAIPGKTVFLIETGPSGRDGQSINKIITTPSMSKQVIFAQFANVNHLCKIIVRGSNNLVQN